MVSRHLAAVFGVALATWVGGCATVSIATDYDRSVSFSRYRSFAIAGGHIQVDGLLDDGNTLLKDRIQRAISGALRGKGLVETPTGPDLVVGYIAGARTRTEIEGMQPYAPGLGPFWYGGWWAPGFADWWTRTYDEGTLVIDLVDQATHRLVWRAYARAEVKEPVTDQKVREAVDQAFARYPPRP
jgi:Domain of unknown function (DUF4136)